MSKMDLGDVTIHYEEAGTGPLAYVFCHGLGGSGQAFVEEFPFWQQHFGRVVTWDNRGLGGSSRAEKYSLSLYAWDLARLLDQLKVRKGVVHGVSWGGIVVQQFVLDYPEQCAAIIIDSSSSEVNVAASEAWYDRGEVARLGQQATLREFRPAFPGHAPRAQIMQEEGNAVRPEHVDSYVASARAIAGLREHPLTPRLKNITCPALVVGAGQDPTAGAAGSVILARNLPNASLRIFQDSGHGVFRHKREEFRALVLEFCRDHGLI
ncbi:MAG: alpha/beta hydrolase [Chloroflexi bacterium]|nr:alpha/beta hydrolase [Chloroflexota bacterium]